MCDRLYLYNETLQLKIYLFTILFAFSSTFLICNVPYMYLLGEPDFVSCTWIILVNSILSLLHNLLRHLDINTEQLNTNVKTPKMPITNNKNERRVITTDLMELKI